MFRLYNGIRSFHSHLQNPGTCKDVVYTFGAMNRITSLWKLTLYPHIFWWPSDLLRKIIQQNPQNSSRQDDSTSSCGTRTTWSGLFFPFRSRSAGSGKCLQPTFSSWVIVFFFALENPEPEKHPGKTNVLKNLQTTWNIPKPYEHIPWAFPVMNIYIYIHNYIICMYIYLGWRLREASGVYS